MQDEHESENVECSSCGTEFNLARQNYYDNLCPSCMKEENPERTWPRCVNCDDKIPPSERAYKTVRGAARDPGTVRLPVHEDCKDDNNSRSRGMAGP